MSSSVLHSLRFKLALTFALFGAMISLLLSLGLFFTAHSLGVRLMDETLRAEIDDYIFRRARNPNSLPPATVSIHGYLLTPRSGNENIPPELRTLPAGTYQLTLSGTPYRIVVADKDDDRYFMLFNENRQNHREETFIVYLVSGALIMILVSAWAGWWLAGRVVAPIEELARRVLRASPEQDASNVAAGFQNDEIGQLAQVFSSYLGRMRAFIERERNFTSDVSHELRTPLAIVQGVVELMEDERQETGKRQERIARISRANREMSDLTNALLLMARENTDEMVAQVCDVCEIVGVAIEMNRHLLSEQTALDIVCRAQPHIGAERTLLGIVVANLIRNAFTHTPSGTVSITVDENELIVSDTGTGIRGDEMGKVFQQHFKGAASTGSGIGLSLVKRICDRYGWEIILGSTEGRGTSARLVFSGNSLTFP
ncbi:MAG: HAMP domain-containing histidine kinase [Nitrosomonadales bacterium]|nr:HAMP domain-containing histidine kinase [Nitrosomonadales bacterium]